MDIAAFSANKQLISQLSHEYEVLKASGSKKNRSAGVNRTRTAGPPGTQTFVQSLILQVMWTMAHGSSSGCGRQLLNSRKEARNVKHLNPSQTTTQHNPQQLWSLQREIASTSPLAASMGQFYPVTPSEAWLIQGSTPTCVILMPCLQAPGFVCQACTGGSG